ncbi:MAG: hypothetical protein KJ941_08195 [Bacteroidetes bacterium]|nr:hypothetical protein [Bacteroidota bacterium]
MKNTILSLLVLFSFQSFAQNVHFGEHESSTLPSLYFDKDGNLYPSERISDSDMETAKSSLSNFYKSNPAVFNKVCEDLTVENKGVDGSIQDVNTAIFNREMAKFSNESKNLTFLIHGFRKAFKQQNEDESSIENFESMVSSIPPGQERQFVRVFWDGLYDCCITLNVADNMKIFKLFESSIVNADNVGKSFGRMLAQSPIESYTLLSFSLGAKVIASALPSIDKKLTPYYVILVAPAIDGADITTALSKIERRNKLELTIVYNEDDFVLMKKDPKSGLIGPGPNKFGVTTLGCNYKKEAEYTKTHFDNHLVKCRLVKFNFIGKTHKVSAYFDPLYGPLIWGY